MPRTTDKTETGNMAEQQNTAQQHTIVMTMQDAMLAQQQEQNRRRLAEIDAQRAASPKVMVRVINAFHIVDDPATPLGRLVPVGEEFEVPECDLYSWSGKAIPLSIIAKPEELSGPRVERQAADER